MPKICLTRIVVEQYSEGLHEVKLYCLPARHPIFKTCDCHVVFLSFLLQTSVLKLSWFLYKMAVQNPFIQYFIDNSFYTSLIHEDENRLNFLHLNPKF